MTPAEALASHRAFISEGGETVYIRRYAGNGPNADYTDTATMARIIGYQPKEIVGKVVAGDSKAIALVDTLPFVLPVTAEDSLVVGGGAFAGGKVEGGKEIAIKYVDDRTRRVAGVLIALEIQIGG